MREEQIRQNLLIDIQKLMAPEGYLNAGYPNYNTLFGRDSLISAWQLLRLNPKIAASTLTILAKHQATEIDLKKEAEPGKILHEYRFSWKEQQELPAWEWPYYGSVDSTSLFLIILAEYIKATGDLPLLSALWPAATEAMNWHIENASRNKHGFITYSRQNPQGLFHQGWKDSSYDHLKIRPPVAIVEEQGYAYAACKAYAYLCDLEITKTISPGRLRALMLAQKIKANFHDNYWSTFWMVNENYPALAIDGKGYLRMAVTSNPGHLLACGDFLYEPGAKAIVNRLFHKDLWTMGGIRTLSDKDPDFDPLSYHLGSIWPHDNWLIYKGLKLWGFEKEADRIKRALLRAYGTLGCIPECYAVIKGFLGREKIIPLTNITQLKGNVRNLGEHLPSFNANSIQAWSISALLNMLDE